MTQDQNRTPPLFIDSLRQAHTKRSIPNKSDKGNSILREKLYLKDEDLHLSREEGLAPNLSFFSRPLAPETGFDLILFHDSR